eukprot:7211691-Lingulodinium_polyedra.AAC.1
MILVLFEPAGPIARFGRLAARRGSSISIWIGAERIPNRVGSSGLEMSRVASAIGACLGEEDGASVPDA